MGLGLTHENALLRLGGRRGGIFTVTRGKITVSLASEGENHRFFMFESSEWRAGLRQRPERREPGVGQECATHLRAL